MHTGSCRSPRGFCALLANAAAIAIGVIALFAAGAVQPEVDAVASRTAGTPRKPAGLPAHPVVLDHARLHPGSDPQAPCTCATDKFYNGWCWHCNVGYIAGHQIKSATLFETLDPHGHDIDSEMLREHLCPDAVPNDGWCDAIAMGFVHNKAFFTRLTWGLAKGEPINPDDLICPICRGHILEPGWCDRCQRGIVGNVAYPAAERQTFERTAEEYRNLLAAIERGKVCEVCSSAMMQHCLCPKCKISYARRTSPPSPANLPDPCSSPK